jgi:hypothetical protein
MSDGASPSPGFWAWLSLPYRQSRSFRRWTLAFLVLAAVSRLWLISISHWLPVADTRDYHEFARNLADGKGYMQVYHGEFDFYDGMTFYAYRMPGYPALLAGLYTLFGWNPHVAMIFNLLAELITQLILGAIAWHLFGRWVSLFSQAVWTVHFFSTTDLITESTFTLLFIFAVALLIHGAPLRCARGALGFGVVSILAIFVRPIGIVLYGILGVKTLVELFYARIRFGRATVLVLLALLPTLVGLGLWSQRNYRILGHRVMFTTQAGRINARDYGLSFERVVSKLRRQGIHNEAEINNALKERVKGKMQRNPGRVLDVYARRFMQLFNLRGAVDRRALHFNVLFNTPQSPWWLEPAMVVLYGQYYIIYGLAAAAPFILIAQHRRWLDLALVILVFAGVHAGVSKGNIRFAAPFFPILVMLAGCTLEFLWNLQRRLSGRPPMPVA